MKATNLAPHLKARPAPQTRGTFYISGRVRVG